MHLGCGFVQMCERSCESVEMSSVGCVNYGQLKIDQALIFNPLHTLGVRGLIPTSTLCVCVVSSGYNSVFHQSKDMPFI